MVRLLMHMECPLASCIPRVIFHRTYWVEDKTCIVELAVDELGLRSLSFAASKNTKWCYGNLHLLVAHPGKKSSYSNYHCITGYHSFGVER